MNKIRRPNAVQGISSLWKELVSWFTISDSVTIGSCDHCTDIVHTKQTVTVNWAMTRSDFLRGKSEKCQFCDLFLRIVDEFFPGLDPLKHVTISRIDGDRSFRIACRNSQAHENARALDVHTPLEVYAPEGGKSQFPVFA